MKLFLKGFAGILIIAGLLCGCSRCTERIQSVDTAMGTVIQTVLYVDTDAQEGYALSAQLREKIMMLEEEVLSVRIPDSEISQLNQASQTGQLQSEGWPLSEALFEELLVIQEVAERSGGALDITLGAAAALWNLDRAATDQSLFRMPDPEQLTEAVENSGWEKVSLNDGKAMMPEGLYLDPGAVGKGIACDRLADQLQELEPVRAAVISLGGSILTYGEKTDGTAWKVGIVDPFDTSGYLGYLTLHGSWNIATSGDYERFVDVDGVRYHHILDPADGYPARSGLRSVTIFGQSGLLCDALSTACFVLGAEEGIALAEGYDVFAVMVTEDGQLIFSSGAREYFTDEK